MNKHKLSRLAILGLPLLLVALSGNSQAAGVSFAKHVKPLLDKHCTECHRSGGEGATKSGFLIESYDSLMKGTKFGAVIVPGDAVSSSLYRLLAGEVDPSIRMPHNKDPLPASDITIVEKWINQGAKNN
ncbi:Planctomycete cytochrome C [Allochromatium warmingii]|uniref:Planctomycete cytochrome C n=1 Tax=Allochromatium warmingii TaxID=61595 RepID=A0A1H3H7H0_ALLWA|nr:c-type cytochrome domain-containing protein [Allochromatium warmingii]SDY11155.1 Planctomycete cytochrome C [Allochromatium warmingii]